MVYTNFDLETLIMKVVSYQTDYGCSSAAVGGGAFSISLCGVPLFEPKMNSFTDCSVESMTFFICQKYIYIY